MGQNCKWRWKRLISDLDDLKYRDFELSHWCWKLIQVVINYVDGINIYMKENGVIKDIEFNWNVKHCDVGANVWDNILNVG